MLHWYKGRGEHSVMDLERMVEERNEELQVLKQFNTDKELVKEISDILYRNTKGIDGQPTTDTAQEILNRLKTLKKLK